jgi:hypothetical protein
MLAHCCGSQEPMRIGHLKIIILLNIKTIHGQFTEHVQARPNDKTIRKHGAGYHSCNALHLNLRRARSNPGRNTCQDFRDFLQSF